MQLKYSVQVLRISVIVCPIHVFYLLTVHLKPNSMFPTVLVNKHQKFMDKHTQHAKESQFLNLCQPCKPIHGMISVQVCTTPNHLMLYKVMIRFLCSAQASVEVNANSWSSTATINFKKTSAYDTCTKPNYTIKLDARNLNSYTLTCDKYTNTTLHYKSLHV